MAIGHRLKTRPVCRLTTLWRVLLLLCALQEKYVSGNWNDWGEWGTCSTTCNNGVKYRSRSCNQCSGCQSANQCTGSAVESTSCSTEACPNWLPSWLDDKEELIAFSCSLGAGFLLVVGCASCCVLCSKLYRAPPTVNVAPANTTLAPQAGPGASYDKGTRNTKPRSRAWPEKDDWTKRQKKSGNSSLAPSNNTQSGMSSINNMNKNMNMTNSKKIHTFQDKPPSYDNISRVEMTEPKNYDGPPGNVNNARMTGGLDAGYVSPRMVIV